jgi:hypothetical protein
MDNIDAFHIALIIWGTWSTAMWWHWEGQAKKLKALIIDRKILTREKIQ